MNEPVEQAIELIDPEYRPLVRGLLSRLNVNSSISVGEFIRTTPKETLTYEEKMAVLLLTNVNTGKYAPKLSFVQRCEVLALNMRGFTDTVLAKIYQVDRRTVGYIVNDHSVHYKSVRQQAVTMGKDRFLMEYITESVLNTAYAFNTNESTKEKGNNIHANRKAGFHIVRGKDCAYDHRVEIAWKEGENGGGPGWYYRDLDGDQPEEWFWTFDKEGHKTSIACYNMLLSEITDRMIKK